MTTTLPATCEDGVVSVLGVAVPDVNILSEGVGPSVGVLLVFGGDAYYIARTSPDLDETLEKLIVALGKIVSALSALDGAGFLIAATAGVPSLPLATDDISDIDAAKTDLQTLKDSLR